MSALPLPTGQVEIRAISVNREDQGYESGYDIAIYLREHGQVTGHLITMDLAEAVRLQAQLAYTIERAAFARSPY